MNVSVCGSSRDGCNASAINLLTVPNLENEHDEAVGFNFADKLEISHAVSPEFPKAGALQGSPDATGIV